MTKEQQKNIILRVANKYQLSSKVIEMLFQLVDENKHWRNKNESKVDMAFKRLSTYNEGEQIKFIENAIIGEYRGLCWKAKEQPKKQSYIQELLNLSK